ncbi:MAG: UvrD-helicase domain-containing protein [Candidatus Omnitrophota bacterium]|jgi:ATP-dependent exoDNAse (exonuclease V) beta subunit
MNNKDPRLLQFPQVLIVEASAGSGKTYALARRYIYLLMHSCDDNQAVPLHAILAITFTNKAAIEMKERILELVKKIALDAFSSPQEKVLLLESLDIDEESARQKAFVIMEALLRNYNFFQVQTIDSFINAILCGCAFKLDLSARFKTEKDYHEYLAYSLDKLIDRASSDPQIFGLFSNFLTQYIYIENRAGWFPKQYILRIITALFSKSNRYAGGFLRTSATAEELFSRKEEIQKLFYKLKELLPAGTNAAFKNSLSAFLERQDGHFSLEKVSDFFKREDVPVNKGNAIPEELRLLWRTIRVSLAGLCELEAVFMLNYYVAIFTCVLDGLKEAACKDDVLFLEALNKEARSLFDEKNLGLPELYYRLATRFKHFLLDEFQDTSRLQWENLFIMIQEALSCGGSLFYVGDKKQAIYRFRGGEVALIDSQKERLRDFNLIEESLTTNYRSRQEIVTFNNMLFSQSNLGRFLQAQAQAKTAGVALDENDCEEILGIFRSCAQESLKNKPGGFVKSAFIEYTSKEERQELLKPAVLDLLRELTARGVLSRDIAFIVRKNDQVELLTSWLLEHNIPVESEKTLNIKQNSYIKELVSFLVFLNSPIDNLAFASFILGDIFSRASGISPEQIQDFIFKLHNSSQESGYLYREFKERFPEVWDRLFEDFFKSVGFVPLYELVVSIYRGFNVVERFVDYQGFFMRFLELIKEVEEKKPSIQVFLDFFASAPDEDLYVTVAHTDSIKVLTIHKSKGLEFPVVILPFLEMSVKVEHEVIVPAPEGLKLLYLKKRYTDFSDSLSRIYRNEYIKAFIDELNSIYVATTRPKDELYIFISPKTETGFNIASLLLPENNHAYGSVGDSKPALQGQRPSPLEIAPAAYKDWINLLKDEFIDEHTLDSRTEIIRGEVFHYIFSCIGNCAGFDKQELLNGALLKAKMRFPVIADFTPYSCVVATVLADKRFERYFNVNEGQVFQEKEIVDRSGVTKRLDRLVITAQEAWVIDYKSSSATQERYSEQITEYIAVVKDIYPHLKVKGLLIYLDSLHTKEFT